MCTGAFAYMTVHHMDAVPTEVRRVQEMKLQMVVRQYVGAGTRAQAICYSNEHYYLLNHFSNPYFRI